MTGWRVWSALLCGIAVAGSEEPRRNDLPPQFQEVVRRNIFRQSFFPGGPESSAPGPPVPRPSPEVLTGIMKLDSRCVALVENKEAGTSQLVHVGSEVKGAKVAEIHMDSPLRIVLEKGGQRHIVELGEPIGTVMAPASSAPAASGSVRATPSFRSPTSSKSSPIPSDKLRALIERMRKRRKGQTQ